MKYINLIDELSTEDKKKIEDYIYSYGIKKDNFEGLENWLQNWSHSNQKLYKLLGNNFDVTIPIDIQKDDNIFYSEISNQLLYLPFFKTFQNFCNHIEELCPNLQCYTPGSLYSQLSQFKYESVYIHNKIEKPIKIKIDNKKMLQISIGMKPIKALGKIIEYFKDIIPDFFKEEEYEELRIKHSILLTDKNIKGNIHISIHPLDFLTMSDNDSNWTSCMSWKDGGCYHIGTVEMMNSNNVLCCYLTSNESDFHYGKNQYNNVWNNKTYRVLTYITKDIIMSGKSYPYQSDMIAKTIIQAVKELAEKNLNWTYSFGPELYKDMKYIHSSFAMERTRMYMNHSSKKHNIIWDTKGMYNDMLNDSDCNYWCYRNKVKHTKILSVSGKAPCLCCHSDVLVDSGYLDIYNERFERTGTIVCKDCSKKIAKRCDDCYRQSVIEDYSIVTINGKELDLCPSCLEEYFKKCPICNKNFLTNTNNNNCITTSSIDNFMIDQVLKQNEIEIISGSASRYTLENYCQTFKKFEYLFEELYCCEDCINKLQDKGQSIKILKEKWNDEYVSKVYYLLKLDEAQKYRYKNLEKGTY